MKFVKIIACLLALISALTMFASCTITNHGAETTPAATDDPQEQVVYKANVHLIVTDHNGKEVYTTMSENPEDNIPHAYESGFEEPYIFAFIEDYKFFNEKTFDYEATSRKKTVKNENGEEETVTLYTLKEVRITLKKKTKSYASGTVVTFEKDGKKYQTETYWVFYVNGVEVKESNEKLLKDGDVLELRLSYDDTDMSNPVEETPVVPNEPETEE